MQVSSELSQELTTRMCGSPVCCHTNTPAAFPALLQRLREGGEVEEKEAAAGPTTGISQAGGTPVRVPPCSLTARFLLPRRAGVSLPLSLTPPPTGGEGKAERGGEVTLGCNKEKAATNTVEAPKPHQ